MTKRNVILVPLLAAFISLPVSAQEYRGNLYLAIHAGEGQPVAGAKVTVGGVGASRTAETDGGGEIHFIKLEPGSYTVEVEKDGFNTMISEGVVVNTLANTSLEIQLQRTEIVERITVQARTPLMDKRRIGTTTVVDPEEITKIPTARDPWAVMSTIPGFQTNLVNVGGNYSGEQSVFVAKGDRWNSTYVMDGIEITDMAAVGATSTYFDFNSFSEIAFTTAGGNPEQYTPGPRLDFATKQGSNRHSGAFGLLLAKNAFQSGPSTPVNPDGTLVAGNEINEVFEKNFEVGGRLVRDKAWYWFGYSQNDIVNLVPGEDETQQTKRVKLENVTAKVNATLGKTSLKLFYTRGDKIARGRGASPTRTPPTTLDQEGPSPIYTFDVSHFFTRNLEASAQYSHVGGGFQLTPQGDAPQVLWDADFVFRNTYDSYQTDRPQDQFAVRGNWFADSGPVSHELKFGFRYKEVTVQSRYAFGSEDVYAVEWAPEAWLLRQENRKVGQDYTSVWLGDTILAGNWTFNVGATYIRQSGEQLPSVAPANGLCPTCLPDLRFAGFDPGFVWEDILPRAGLTYTFGGARRRLVRASAGRYAWQLGTWEVGHNSPMGYAIIYYPWNDLDGDRLVDTGEFDPDCTTGPVDSWNVDPCNPTQTIAANSTDPGLKAPLVDELIVGYEVELMKDFTLGLNYTRREEDRVLWWPLQDLVNGGIIDASYWVPTAPVNGTIQCYDDTEPCEIPQSESFTVQPYVLTDEGIALTDRSRPYISTNRDGYSREFDGIELVATKRLSNRWMLRGFVAWQDWTKSIECHSTGPTGECTSGPGIQNPVNRTGDSTRDGSIVTHSAASKTGWSFGNARWQYNVNGLYQLPKNFTISANIQGREGYSLPLFIREDVFASDGIRDRQNLQILGADWYRKEDLHMVDLRLSYLMLFGDDTTLDLSFEVFNLLNADAILRLSPDLRGNMGQIHEVLSPRVFRVGARVNFQ